MSFLMLLLLLFLSRKLCTSSFFLSSSVSYRRRRFLTLDKIVIRFFLSFIFGLFYSFEKQREVSSLLLLEVSGFIFYIFFLQKKSISHNIPLQLNKNFPIYDVVSKKKERRNLANFKFVCFVCVCLFIRRLNCRWWWCMCVFIEWRRIAAATQQYLDSFYIRHNYRNIILIYSHL